MNLIKICVLMLFLNLVGNGFANAQMSVMYQNFPEDFKPMEKSVQEGKKTFIKLKSGEWELKNAVLTTIADSNNVVEISKKSSEAGCLQMNFDVTEGAWKVKFSYGTNNLGVPTMSPFQFEFSTDQGRTWEPITKSSSYLKKGKMFAVFNLDIKDPVRFRIKNKASAEGENSVLVIDDFSIRQNEKYH